MARLLSVKRKKDEPIEKLLRRYKRKVEESEHLIELRDRREFIKPSLQKRIQKEQAIRLNQQEVQRLKEENGGK